MVQEFTVLLWDDVDIKGNVKTPAETSATVGFDGRWYELDLTDKHKKELAELLEPWIDASHAPDAPVTAKRLRRSRAFNTGMRQYAEKHGISYMTDSGKYYYSRRLIKEYSDHLEKLDTSGQGPL